jgi:broad specificity phosphatase PhoE
MSSTFYINVSDSDKSLNHQDCIDCLNWKMYNHLGDIYNSSNTLYILRHGHSEANKQKLIASDIKNCITNYGLTPKGIEEIRTSVSPLNVLGHPKTEFVLYSSPFLRTVQTASRVTEVLLVKDTYYDTRFRERFFGEWELTEDSNYQKIWNEDYISPCHKKWGVESTYEVLERVTSAVREIDAMYQKKHIIFVTHGDTAQILMCGYSNRNPQTHRHTNLMKTGQLNVLHKPV